MVKGNLQTHLSSVLFWAVISAAFIGPGTVTTAATSGSSYGYSLIWVLILSTFMCIILQVNVTKLTIETGRTFGELLLQKFRRRLFIPMAVGFSIVFGCMAYQAGNLLGAALGLKLLFNIDQSWIVLIISIISGLLLWFGTVNLVVRLLGVVVALMGIAFIYIVFSMDFNIMDLLVSTLIPGIPDGSEILIMGLMGTTIVPYNLFLGSGLSKGKSLVTSRIGLAGAIGIGGIISITILLVGTLVNAPLNFEKLSVVLSKELGLWAKYMLAFGLFSAGFTSSITAPLAAIFTIKSIFPERKGFSHRTGMGYKSIWGLVMATGVVFGFLNIKPIPVIILAQAINGILLPFIVSFILILTISAAMRKGYLHLNKNTIALIIATYVIITLGTFNIVKLLNMGDMTGIAISALFGFVIIGLIISATIRKVPDNSRPQV